MSSNHSQLFAGCMTFNLNSKVSEIRSKLIWPINHKFNLRQNGHSSEIFPKTFLLIYNPQPQYREIFQLFVFIQAWKQIDEYQPLRRLIKLIEINTINEFGSRQQLVAFLQLQKKIQLMSTLTKKAKHLGQKSQAKKPKVRQQFSKQLLKYHKYKSISIALVDALEQIREPSQTEEKLFQEQKTFGGITNCDSGLAFVYTEIANPILAQYTCQGGQGSDLHQLDSCFLQHCPQRFIWTSFFPKMVLQFSSSKGVSDENSSEQGVVDAVIEHYVIGEGSTADQVKLPVVFHFSRKDIFVQL